LIPPIFEIKNSNKMHVFVDIKELENYLVDICNFYEKTKKLQIKNLIKIDNELKNIFEKFLIKLKNQKKFFQEIINQKIKIKKINLNYFKKNFIPYEFQLDFANNIISKKYVGNFSSSGSGKTIITIMAAISLFYKNEIDTLLVIGPKSSSIA
jgi:uncharacterized protein YebE (UPF0316 family)